MVSHYHHDIVFSDPAFGTLKQEEACDMWRMLISKGGDDLKVDLLSVEEEGDQVKAKWKARYCFGKKKRPVVNEISATFDFQDEKIVRHRDDFDLWKWAGQAMGATGKLIGWTKFFMKKVQKTTRGQLSRFQDRHRS